MTKNDSAMIKNSQEQGKREEERGQAARIAARMVRWEKDCQRMSGRFG
jgi:hypothetical protein